MPDSEERRERVLTDGDLEALAKLIQTHSPAQSCSIGLTQQQADLLKRILNAFESASSVVGKTILISLVVGMITIFTKGFWISLFEAVVRK